MQDEWLEVDPRSLPPARPPGARGILRRAARLAVAVALDPTVQRILVLALAVGFYVPLIHRAWTVLTGQ